MSNYGFTSAGTSYDDEDRLTGFARASGTFTQSWSLTSVGDWNSITTNGTAQNRTHGPTHELLTAGGQNVTTDVKGNITLLPTTLTTSGVAMAVGYDFDNKLKSADIDNNGSNDVTFQYDALGRRVARQGTSGSFVYVQQDQQTIADYGYGDAPSSPTHRYVYASYIDEPVVRKAAGTSGTIHYYHRNQQYSITAVTTSSGSVAERYAYTAYGQPTLLDGSGSVLSSSAINNRYTYTGREWDATLGLYHFRARWMSGLAGRFMGRDPFGYVDGLHIYRNFLVTSTTDPHGNCVKCCCCAENLTGDFKLIRLLKNPSGNGIIPVAGHELNVIATESWVRGEPSSCTLEWWERTNHFPPYLKNAGAVNGNWFNVMARFPQTPVFSDFQNKQRPCPGIVNVPIKDTPAIGVPNIPNITRTLDFAIRLISAPDCDCSHSEITIFFRQVITLNGRGVAVPAPTFQAGGVEGPWPF